MKIAASAFASLSIAILASEASAQTSGLFLTNYESYTGTLSCGGPTTLCAVSFPQNVTGKRIKVTKLSCLFITDDVPVILFAIGVGDFVGGIGNKRSAAAFNPPARAGTSYVLSVESEPMMIMGPDKFFTMRPETASATSFNGFCSLSGQSLD